MLFRFRVAVLCTLFLPAVATTRAAITVDPLSTGATDVTTGFSSTETPLINPVADSLDVNGLLQVGSTGEGQLLVNNGSLVDTHQTWVGIRTGSSGLLTLDGPGTHWSASSEIRIGGNNSTGTLEILNGATLSSEQGYIVASSGGGMGSGTVSVRGSGSRWEIDSSVLRLGFSSTFPALLTIEDGGVVDVNISGSSSFSSSTQISSAGSIALTGNQSSLHKQGDFSIVLGEVWSDSLLVGQGASVDVDGSLIVSQNFSSTSNVRLAGGTLNVESLYIDPTRLVGNGTVNAQGLVSDIDLEFGGNEGLQQQLSVPGQNIDIHLDLSDPGALGVGYYGTAELLVNESMQLLGLKQLVLGMHGGSHGTATVTGVGTRVEVLGPLQVGVEGEGSLTIGSQAAVDAAEVMMGPEGSIEFNNGKLNADTLFTTGADLTGVGRINAKGLVFDGDLLFDGSTGDFPQIRLNQLPGQNISINLDLSDSSVLGVGYRGEGSLVVEGGKILNTSRAYLGYADNGVGHATVSGEGSSWLVEEDLSIGSGISGSATGSLDVTQGANVEVINEVYVNNGSTVSIADAGSNFQVLRFLLNNGSDFEVSGGAVALVHNNLEAFNSTVRIRGEGSTLMVDGGVVVQDSNLTIENQGLVSLLFGDLVVGSSSTVVLRGGVLDMGNGRVNLQSPSSQFLFAEGTLKNVIRFDGNLAQSGGVLEISQSGPLSIDGAFTMTSDATLRVDLADFSAFGSSFLQVQNQVVLAGGTLKILLGEGEGPFYEPRLGDAFSIFGGSYSMLIGEFDELILPELDEGLVWDLSYDSEVFGNPQVILEVVAGFSGDFTGDGSVDAADLGEWESRFGDDLDGRDFLNWQRQYGSGDQPLAIPEPSTAVLILSALLPLLAATPAGVRAPLPGLRLRGNTFCDCVVSRPSES